MTSPYRRNPQKRLWIKWHRADEASFPKGITLLGYCLADRAMVTFTSDRAIGGHQQTDGVGARLEVLSIDFWAYAPQPPEEPGE